MPLKSDYWLKSRDSGMVGFVVFTGDPAEFLRFDWRTDGWVVDPKMIGIYVGSPLVDPITEDEAREAIESRGGTWSVPEARPLDTPERKRMAEIRAQMQANVDAIPRPPGSERIPNFRTEK
jgi:hypothetical protein